MNVVLPPPEQVMTRSKYEELYDRATHESHLSSEAELLDYFDKLGYGFAFTFFYNEKEVINRLKRERDDIRSDTLGINFYTIMFDTK